MYQPRRAVQCNTCAVVLLVVLFALAVLFHTATRSSSEETSTSAFRLGYYPPKYAFDAPTVTVTISAPKPTTVSKPLLLNENATGSFTDNLRPELKYITAWPAQGWNNQMMEIMNLLYLSIITERVPILPQFSDHSGEHMPTTEHVHIGEIIDIPRLEKGIKRPILEWRQVKDPQSESWESIGCWNLVDSGWPPLAHIPNLKLDVSYAKLPSRLKSQPDNSNDQYATFWALASLGFSDTRPEVKVDPATTHKTALTPDEHLLCFDNLFYVSARGGWEIESSYSPAWRFVGRHMHWTAKIQTIADDYIRAAFGLAPEEEMPAFIAVHIRRGDFKKICKDMPEGDCLPPLSAYARAVEELKGKALSMKGIAVERVIVASDETDSEWWADARELGWSSIDQADITEKYGPWYPVFVDGVVLSSGVGFIGTSLSTVSFLADKRVAARGGLVGGVGWSGDKKFVR